MMCLADFRIPFAGLSSQSDVLLRADIVHVVYGLYGNSQRGPLRNARRIFWASRNFLVVRCGRTKDPTKEV